MCPWSLLSIKLIPKVAKRHNISVSLLILVTETKRNAVKYFAKNLPLT